MKTTPQNMVFGRSSQGVDGSRSVVLVALAVSSLFGCASEEAINPVPVPSSSGPTPEPGSGGGAPDPGPPVREVYVRNPIGGPLGNLLADGDFELSIVPEQAAGGQYGWVAFTTSGNPAPILSETGGLCRSGLRCGRIAKRAILFGRGTSAPNEAPHRMSIWLKSLEGEPTPSCALASVVVIGCDTFDVRKTLKRADAPDDRGWCEFSGDVAGSRKALCVYAEIEGQDVLADAAYLRAVESTTTPTPAPWPIEPVDSGMRARMDALRDRLRARTPLAPAEPLREPGPARPD